MKLFAREKTDTTSVPPELQQYYQVPGLPTKAKKSRPVATVLLAVLVAAVLIGGVVWLISYNPINSSNSDSKQSNTTQAQKTKNPATKPGSSTVNTQPIPQPGVQ